MAEPKVRFKRDDGGIFPAWEQGRFGDLIEVYDEKVTSDCTLPVLTSSKTDGIQYQSDHFGREQLHDITGYNVIPRGYCTYRNRSDGTDFTFNINNLCDRGIVSKFYPVFHTTARCNLYFLMTLMNNEPKTVRKIAMTAKGTGQKVLSFLDLQKIEINIPSFEEQQKIADFLSSVDEVISTSEQEVANLETQKKAVMKKIFSQEVRFKRADGSDFPYWEEKDLIELFPNIRNGFVGTVTDFFTEKEKGIRYLEGTNIHDGIISDNVELYVTKAFHKKHINNELKADDIIMVQSGHVGDCAVVGEKYAGANCHALIIMSNAGNCHSDFYVAYFHSPAGMKEIAIKATGNTVKHILASVMQRFRVPYPCLEEQRLIADFLSDFDEAITAAKKELDLWKELKKGLLQQMFV